MEESSLETVSFDAITIRIFLNRIVNITLDVKLMSRFFQKNS